MVNSFEGSFVDTNVSRVFVHPVTSRNIIVAQHCIHRIMAYLLFQLFGLRQNLVRQAGRKMDLFRFPDLFTFTCDTITDGISRNLQGAPDIRNFPVSRVYVLHLYPEMGLLYAILCNHRGSISPCGRLQSGGPRPARSLRRTP